MILRPHPAPTRAPQSWSARAGRNFHKFLVLRGSNASAQLGDSLGPSLKVKIDQDSCRHYTGAVGQQLTGVVGPFPYMKGPLYFVSRTSVERLVGEQQHLLELVIPTAGAKTGFGRARTTAIWEDVFLGYALGRLADAKLGVVSIDWSLFYENWGFGINPASLVWHAKLKDPSRLPLIQRWKDKHHCTRRREARALVCEDVGRSCTGELWPLCYDRNEPAHNCSEGLLCGSGERSCDLKRLYSARLLNASYSI